MKARIALNIETRDEQHGCSWRCPYLKTRRGEILTVEHYCLLFGELHPIPGRNCVRRSPKCLSNQIPFDENKKLLRPKRLAPNKAPTTWERINGKDKL